MAHEDETVRPADEGPVERRVRPQAWSPALTYQNYEQQRVWANGEPRPEDVAYWKAQGLGVTLAYTAEDVRYMLEGAWCAGYYHAGYTHDSAYAEKQAEKCADEFLGPNAAGNRLARQGQSELTGLLGPGSEARKTMDDKTLLLKAARAAGYGIHQRGQSLREAELPNEPSLWLTHATWWNPLTDSGQALDLAVTLEMDIGQMLTEGHVTVTGVAFDGEALAHDVPWGTDPCAATRRAIVLVAADMAN